MCPVMMPMLMIDFGVSVLWLQKKNDDDKKNRADEAKWSEHRQVPVKQVFPFVSVSSFFAVLVRQH